MPSIGCLVTTITSMQMYARLSHTETRILMRNYLLFQQQAVVQFLHFFNSLTQLKDFDTIDPRAPFTPMVLIKIKHWVDRISLFDVLMDIKTPGVHWSLFVQKQTVGQHFPIVYRLHRQQSPPQQHQLVL